MAATKFTAIYANNEDKIIEREIPGMNTYKIAEKFAKMLNDPEETRLICVVESWKLYPTCVGISSGSCTGMLFIVTDNFGDAPIM
jgi:hypothetical protein